MAIINDSTKTQNVVDKLHTDSVDTFAKAFETTVVNFDPLISYETTNGSIVEHVVPLSAPAPREVIGIDRQLGNVVIKSKLTRVRTYANAVTVHRRDIMGDRTGAALQRINSMGAAFKRLPDRELAALLRNGKVLDADQSIDGKAFFATDHDLLAGTPQSNLITGAGALDQTKFAAAKARMRSFKDNEGNPFQFTNLNLIVPTALENAGRTVLSTDLIVNGVGGSQTNVNRGDANLIVSSDLDAEPGVWYLTGEIEGLKPFFWYELSGVNFVTKDRPEDENVFMRFEYIYGADSEACPVLGAWFQTIRNE